MIFPDVSLESWLKKYPALKVRKGKCPQCGSRIKTETPFVSSDWAGLTNICSCGYDGMDISVPRTTKMKNKLDKLFNSFS